MSANSTALVEPFVQIGQEFVNTVVLAIPKIIVGALMLVIGWLIGRVGEKLVRKGLEQAQADEWFRKQGLKKIFFNVSITDVGAKSIYYYIMLVFMKEAASKASLPYLAEWFGLILDAVPSFIIGAIIVAGGLLLASFLKKTVEKSGIMFSGTVAQAVSGLVIYFAVVIALPKFGITNVSMLEDTFKFLILGISLGIGLAVGIGFGWAIKEGPARDLFKKKK